MCLICCQADFELIPGVTSRAFAELSILRDGFTCALIVSGNTVKPARRARDPRIQADSTGMNV